MEIKLDTLSLIFFDKDNENHILFLKKIMHDESIKKRFNGFLHRLNSRTNQGVLNKAFFLSNNNELIGFIDIGSYSEEEKAIYLRGAIDKGKRGFNYGHKMLKEVSDYIFKNYPQVEEIKLKIADDNISSIKTAESCEFINMLNGNFEKRNPYKKKMKS